MSKQKNYRRRQRGITPITTPRSSPGVAQFSMSEVAQFSVSLDKALAAALQALTATSSTALTAPSSRPASAPRATRSWWRQAPCRYAPAEVITTILSATEAETPTGRKSFAVLSKLTANA